MLSGWASDEVGYERRRCPRREIFTKDGLLPRFGDQRPADLLLLMTAGCPRHGSTNIYKLCRVGYVMPGERSDASDD